MALLEYLYTHLELVQLDTASLGKNMKNTCKLAGVFSLFLFQFAVFVLMQVIASQAMDFNVLQV